MTEQRCAECGQYIDRAFAEEGANRLCRDCDESIHGARFQAAEEGEGRLVKEGNDG